MTKSKELLKAVKRRNLMKLDLQFFGGGKQERLKEIQDRKVEIRTSLEKDEDVDLDKLETELRELKEEEEKIEQRERLMDGVKDIESGSGEYRTIETFNGGNQKPEKREDKGTASEEYREAFMNFVLRGEKSEVLEKRATTATGDVGTVIPQTVINRIVEKMRSYGMIFSRITQSNIKGGVTVPTSNVKPVATWTDEGSTSAKQKKTTGEVTFAYHKLQCRVAVTLEADTVSMDIFETTIVDNVYEAMIVALEQGIVAGTGTKQPLGIVNDSRVTNTSAVAEADLKSYEKWAEHVSKLPLSAEGKVALIMTKADFDKYILGMTDSAGQPVARVNYGVDGRPQRRFLGYEVIAVEEYLPTFTGAADDDTFAFFANLKDYLLNSNMQYRYKKYFDEDTDEYVHKTTLIADGKLADAQNVLLLQKAPTV
ncbi:phage major capsid protein [Halobacillus salinus]|uniref:phage major capsid protein n=1 Tax=Halobacillus salinus TaxID=192814 RepID=UPI0020CA3ABD|nr:phage major capsid protein [Halobacillus salinus]